MAPLIRQVSPAPDPATAFEGLLDQLDPFFLDGGRDFSGQGRYSFIGCNPFAMLRSKNGAIHSWEDGTGSTLHEGNPFDVLGELLERWEGKKVRGEITLVIGPQPKER